MSQRWRNIFKVTDTRYARKSAVTPFTSEQIEWIQISSQFIQGPYTMTTNNGQFQIIHSEQLFPGDAIQGAIFIYARRTDGIGFFRAEHRFAAWYDGRAISDDDRLSEAGVNLQFNMNDTGDFCNFRVRGRNNQDWDWTVYALWRDFP